MTRTKAPFNVNLSTDSTDPEVLNYFLGVHSTEGQPIDGQPIDVCYSDGRMWKGVPYKPVRNDLDPKYLPNLDLNYDWNDLPKHLAAHSFSTFVADPLAMSNLGKDSLMREAFATPLNQFEDDDILPKVEQLLRVAEYLIHPVTGTAIFKIADQVHARERKFQGEMTWVMAQMMGWYACDKFVANSANMPQTGRKRIEHINSQVYWLVLHPDASMVKCPGPGQRYPGRMSCGYCGRVVPVNVEREPSYCRAPRACRQLAYYERVGSETRRDRELARRIRGLLAEGRTISDIAATLDTSERTARAMVAGASPRRKTKLQIATG